MVVEVDVVLLFVVLAVVTAAVEAEVFKVAAELFSTIEAAGTAEVLIGWCTTTLAGSIPNFRKSTSTFGRTGAVVAAELSPGVWAYSSRLMTAVENRIPAVRANLFSLLYIMVTPFVICQSADSNFNFLCLEL